jgi:ribosomal protein L7Ae-like RNA K-turn-binding protein
LPASDDDAAMLRLLGLGARGGLVSVGVELTRKAASAGKVRVAIVAADVSQHSKDKIVPLLLARGISMIQAASASQLGRAVGRDTTAVVGVLDAKLARGIIAAHEDIRRKA